MPRRAKGLTAAFVDKAAKPGRYADGGGLYLEVRSKAAKFWESHFTLRGKRRSMGGGSATGPTAIALAHARIWNRQAQAVAREGRDPIAERKAEKAKRDADEEKARAEAITFAQVADLYIAAHEPAWRSPQHRRQWRFWPRSASLRDADRRHAGCACRHRRGDEDPRAAVAREDRNRLADEGTHRGDSRLC